MALIGLYRCQVVEKMPKTSLYEGKLVDNRKK